MLKPVTPTCLRIFDLREGQCRWPVDDHEPAECFCGVPTVHGTSWCAAHFMRAFQGDRSSYRPAAGDVMNSTAPVTITRRS
jgi:hypothetical protein